MKTVYKYQLSNAAGTITRLHLAPNFRILCTMLQRDQIYVWIEVENNNPPTEEVNFVWFGTGWELPGDITESSIYIGSVQTPDNYVWHVYRI